MNRRTALIVLMALTAACAKPGADPDDAKPPASASAATADEAAGKGGAAEVGLDAQQVADLGIVVAAVAAASRVPETRGFGVVLDHERVAQAVADLAVAQAASRQSSAALARLQRLAGGEGAETMDALEVAERQASSDAAALALAERKATSVWGQHPPPALSGPGAIRDALAAGRTKLLRATFPLGAYRGGVPAELRFAPLDGATAAAQARTARVWAAPADPDVPGRSFFALVDGEDLSEGEHVSAWAPLGGAEQGVVVPAAAVLIDAGRYWCYVERAAGKFVRVPIDLDRPLERGYFVTDGVRAGDRVVVAAAGLLLARELHPGTDAD
jgi:hypothetical protein